MNHRRGSALLELALSASALVALLAGGIQFGYTFHVYGQLQNALRNGARYASAAGASETCADQIRNVVVYGDPKPSGTAPVVAGLSPAHITVTFTKDAAGAPRNVELAVKGLTIDSLFSVYRFDGKPLISAPFVGPAMARCE